MTPYRSTPAHEGPPPPTELRCALRDVRKGELVQRILVKAWIGLVGALVGLGSPIAGGMIIAAVAVWIFADLRKRSTDDVVFTVRDGQLHIALGSTTPVDEPLGCVLDVRLDSKSITKPLNQARADGINSIFGGAIAGGPSIEVDISRVEFVLSNRKPMSLGEHMSRTQALDVMRKIRLFFRAHGWLPEDERPESVDVVLPKVKKKKKARAPVA